VAGLEACQVAVVGLGNIGRILLERMLAVGVPGDRLVVRDADPTREQDFIRRFGVRGLPLEEAAGVADVVLLAVPPKAALGVVRELRQWLHPGQVIISFVAAVPLALLEDILPEGVAVARVMPNAPSLIGQGMNPVCYGRLARGEAKALVQEVLAALGETVEVRDEQMNWCVGLSGAAMRSLLPALEGMTRAGIEAGLRPEQARRVAGQVMLGTAALALRSDLSFEELKSLTPMETLDEESLADMLQRAARSARDKMDQVERRLMPRGGEG